MVTSRSFRCSQFPREREISTGTVTRIKAKIGREEALYGLNGLRSVKCRVLTGTEKMAREAAGESIVCILYKYIYVVLLTYIIKCSCNAKSCSCRKLFQFFPFIAPGGKLCCEIYRKKITYNAKFQLPTFRRIGYSKSPY